MKKLTLIGCAVLMGAASAAVSQELPELVFEKYELDNGLDVILHEDHSLPMVAVNIWYHVGSKNEKPGRTGFAHLFEHMMFQGSEHHDEDYFLPLHKVGGRVNGSTSEDRTNYWENVPSNQLELALWLEADRMGYLLGAMTQERLDNQRDVVKNEKREGENQPYALAYPTLLELMFPADHPYRHTVIGSMDDLSAASLEDVGEFFRLYYAPNNASLCIAGDFDPDEAKRLVEKHFAPIPPGRPVRRLESWIPRLEGTRRALAEDDVELPRVYMEWHTPERYSQGEAAFMLLSSILSTGKTSRLYESLVYEQQIAQDVRAYQEWREISGVFQIRATAREGVDPAVLEAAIDEELKLLIAEGVSAEELELAQTAYEASFIRRLQRIGGFGGKADQLNAYNTFIGDPGWLARDLKRFRDVTPPMIHAYVRQYLDLERRGILHIVPQAPYSAAEAALDRDRVPPAGPDPTFSPPLIQQTTLDNGLEIYVVEKHELPLVQAYTLVKSGWAADPTDRPGACALTAELLDEGAGSRDALQIALEARRLGARLRTSSHFDGSSVSVNILRSKLEDGLKLMGDLILEPRFPTEELERQRQIYLGRIQQESARPEAVAFKLGQKRLFGEGHPYAQPITGSGTVESIQAIQRGDLLAFYEAHYRPNNAAVVLVGDVTLDEAERMLARTFGKWKRGTLHDLEFPAPRPADDAKVCVVNRPGAEHSVIVVGQLSIPCYDPGRLSLEMLNTVLGGHFGARVNMNLREDKGYTYGAYTQFNPFRESGVFGCSSSVHAEHTAESVAEIMKEMSEIRGPRPVSPEELADSQSRLIMGFPQRFETLGSIAGQLYELILYDLPLDDWQSYMARVQDLDLDDMAATARREIRPEDWHVIVVGDWARIEADLRALELGEILLVEADEI